MTYKTIPNEAYQIQEGLYLHSYSKLINGNYYTFRQVYSINGYCFYDKTQEVYRETDNNEVVLVPENEVQPNERTYYTYMSLALSKNINDLVSVKVEEDFEIV